MCDVTDTSNRKGMKVYRAPEFLYSHMIWVPQRGGSKNLCCKYVLKFNFAPIAGSDFFIFLLRKTQNSWTLLERHSGTLYMFSPPLSPFTHMYSEEPSLRRLKCTEVETGQRRQAPLLDVLSITSFIHGISIGCQRSLSTYRKEFQIFTQIGGTSINFLSCCVTYLGLDLAIFFKHFISIS
jgi:hypothetical protein